MASRRGTNLDAAQQEAFPAVDGERLEHRLFAREAGSVTPRGGRPTLAGRELGRGEDRRRELGAAPRELALHPLHLAEIEAHAQNHGWLSWQAAGVAAGRQATFHCNAAVRRRTAVFLPQRGVHPMQRRPSRSRRAGTSCPRLASGSPFAPVNPHPHPRRGDRCSRRSRVVKRRARLPVARSMHDVFASGAPELACRAKGAAARCQAIPPRVPDDAERQSPERSVPP